MLNRHNLISIIIGLLYLIVLQKLSVPEPVFRFLLPFALLFSAAVTAYNYRYLKHIQKYNFWILLRQLLLFLSSFGIFSLLPSPGLRGIFLVITVALIVLFEYSLGSFAENLQINQTLITAFGFFVFFSASFQYFPDFSPAWFISKPGLSWQFSLQPVYLAGLFFVILLLTRAFYEFVPLSPRVKLVNSLAIALFCTEIYWALTFLPLHYSALAVVLFNIYYFCLILNYYYLFQILSPKKIQFQLMLILICSGLVLLVTPWKIIN